MIYGFDTEDEAAATAALCLYVVWRSRDKGRFQVTPDLWGRVERYLKDSAKRAQSIADLLEALKAPKHVYAGALSPRAMAVGLAGEVPVTPVYQDGRLAYAIQLAPDAPGREFATRVIERADARAVIGRAYRNSSWIVLLVRDRLERERPIEQRLDIIEQGEDA